MRTNLMSSKYFVIFLLLLSTIFDVGTTYATVKDQLYLEGNPIVRGLNWNQSIIIQLVVLIFIIALYLYSYRKQNNIWPNISMNYNQFLRFCIRKQFEFSIKNLKNDIIYTGLPLIWILFFAHFIAGLLAALPLIGGPSILSVMSKIGFNDFRHSQFVIVTLLVMSSIIIGHYPVYLSYVRSREDAR